MNISPLATKLAPIDEDLNKLLVSYRQEFFANAPEGSSPDEHIEIWVKTVLWPLFSSIASEPDLVQRAMLARVLVNTVRSGTVQLHNLAVMGETEVRRIHDEVSKELGL